MSSIIDNIKIIDSTISRNIAELKEKDRGFLSQNILSQLRNLVEHVALLIYENYKDIPQNNNYNKIKEALKHIKSKGKTKFLSRFHEMLQISVSHYTLNEEDSERLMLKYYEYLIRIKEFLYQNNNIHILNNLSDFPMNIDSKLIEYYQKILDLTKQGENSRESLAYRDRFYIHKIKPIYINNRILYEITFNRATDRASKFDRLIAFTDKDILSNYSVKLSISTGVIKIFDKEMKINIIDEWEVSIRPCELTNFSKFFGPKINIGEREYFELMKYLTETKSSLLEVIDLDDESYQALKNQIKEKSYSFRIFNFLDYSRNICNDGKSGSNVIRYLLYSMNNRIIKKQYSGYTCGQLNDLYLDYGCIPFDQMPFNSSLKGHNPKLFDLYSSLDSTNREHELFARLIKINTEQKGKLYTSFDEINIESTDELISKWNDKLYYRHTGRRIEVYKNHAYVNDYERDSLDIMRKLKEISISGITNYQTSVKSWVQNYSYIIDCEEKKQALSILFEKSKVALIYGAAGTGKSTMINHISNFLNDRDKIYLSNTNPAIDNLKRKVRANNCTFSTISKHLKSGENKCDVLIIDECSTVSNTDMNKILNRTKFDLIILVGDVMQIESIHYGNWFSFVKYFLPESSVFELKEPYRTTEQNLLTLWERVRSNDDKILELLTKQKMTSTLNESLFERFGETDEIILCLNYDGLYGINNINAFLQNNNKNKSFYWGTHIYKIGDPIIFNETGRFSPLIYNNLKGVINDIKYLENEIQFEIELSIVINEFDASLYDFILLENNDESKSLIQFTVSKFQNTDNDDDDDIEKIMPFQVAYAVSIHKSQGLEYNAVKLVISDELNELINHNIFYTAITRAKNKLKIYWSPETEKSVLNRFGKIENKKDLSLLKSKLLAES